MVVSPGQLGHAVHQTDAVLPVVADQIALGHVAPLTQAENVFDPIGVEEAPGPLSDPRGGRKVPFLREQPVLLNGKHDAPCGFGAFDGAGDGLLVFPGAAPGHQDRQHAAEAAKRKHLHHLPTPFPGRLLKNYNSAGFRSITPLRIGIKLGIIVTRGPIRQANE
jgi:hypothetical protein